MRVQQVRLLLLVFLLMATSGAVGAQQSGLCPVCALSGESEPHGTAATREYNGVNYSFCAKKCAEEFDSDPAAYVFTTGPAPKLTLTSTTGAVLSPGTPGQVTLLDFWATFCKPCVKSMPELDALYRELREKGVSVIGISTDTGKDREKKVRKFLEKHPVTYPIAVDREESPAWEAYHVKVLSTVYLVDRSGIIVRRWTGAVEIGDVRQAVELLLDESEVGEPR